LGSGLAFAWPPLALGLFSLMALFYIASRVILYRHWGTEQS
jgi:membrane-associated phospholipid phosphatase